MKPILPAISHRRQERPGGSTRVMGIFSALCMMSLAALAGGCARSGNLQLQTEEVELIPKELALELLERHQQTVKDSYRCHRIGLQTIALHRPPPLHDPAQTVYAYPDLLVYTITFDARVRKEVIVWLTSGEDHWDLSSQVRKCVAAIIVNDDEKAKHDEKEKVIQALVSLGVKFKNLDYTGF